MVATSALGLKAMDGAASLTVMEKVADPVAPPKLAAVMVKEVAALKALGVPEMAQELEARASPLGSAGVIAQEVMAPPELVGVCVAMAEPLVAMREFEAKEMIGAMSLTVRSKVVEAEAPPWLVAVMV